MAEKFSHAACKQIVEEICAMLGFNAIKNNSSDVLADIIRSFVIKVGESSVKLCQSAGRSEPNYFDVSKCLKREMNLSMRELFQFYESLSTATSGKSTSATTTTRQQNEEELDLSIFDVNIPMFPKPVPSNLVTCTNEREQNMQTLFNYALKDIERREAEKVTSSAGNSASSSSSSSNANANTTNTGTGQDANSSDMSSTTKSTADDEENEGDDYGKQINDFKFLPPLPPKHTYSFTPVYNRNKAENSLTLQQIRTKHRRMVQTSLTRIHTADLSLNPENAADSSAPEQTSTILYNMIPELTEEPPQPKTEDEDRVRTQKTGKIVNPYLVVAKQRNVTVPLDKRTAREMTVADVISEEVGLAENQYEEISKQFSSPDGGHSSKKKKSKRKRQSTTENSEDEVSYALRKPVIATELHGIEQMLPPSKRAKTTTSSNNKNQQQQQGSVHLDSTTTNSSVTASKK